MGEQCFFLILWKTEFLSIGKKKPALGAYKNKACLDCLRPRVLAVGAPWGPLVGPLLALAAELLLVRSHGCLALILLI